MSYHRKHLQYTSICERSEVLSDTLMVIVTMVITSVIISTFHICNSVKHSVSEIMISFNDALEHIDKNP